MNLPAFAIDNIRALVRPEDQLVDDDQPVSGNPIFRTAEQTLGDRERHITPERDAVQDSALETATTTGERQGGNEEKWEAMFQHLLAYKAKRGHTRVPGRYLDKDGVSLGRWTANQRIGFSKKKRGQPTTLSQHRFARLDGIGFETALKDDQKWEDMFQRLLVYKEEHGHTRVPAGYEDEDGAKLGSWTSRQRKGFSEKKRGDLSSISKHRFDRLEGIGFETALKGHGKPDDEKWEAMFQQLVVYKENHGHTRVPQSYEDEDGAKLGNWTSKMRADFSRKKRGEPTTISQHRFDRLEGIGFEAAFEKGDEKWDGMFQRLLAYKEKHGHTRVPQNYQDEDGAKLGIWTGKQRTVFSKKKRGELSCISQRRFDRLEGIGFEPSFKGRGNLNDEKWEDMFQRLLAYEANHGHTRVPAFYEDEDGAKLGNWTSKQRTDFSRKKRGEPTTISQYRFTRLEGIGFETAFEAGLKRDDQKWEDMFQRLLAYKAKHSHTRVSAGYQDEDGVNLGNWTGNQRAGFTKKKRGEHSSISQHRFDRLEGIGFETSFKGHGKLDDEKWEDMFQRLLAYKAKHGHTRVPDSYQDKDGVTLGTWTRKQRTVFSKKNRGEPSSISHHRFDQLERIGFESAFEPGFERDNQKWEDTFQHLLAYKAKHGHARVPYSYQDEDGINLGRWVATQRSAYSAKKRGHYSPLSQSRIDKLDRIGFEWTVNGSRDNQEKWEGMFQRLLAYKAKHGHARVPLRYQDEDGANLGGWVANQRSSYSRKNRGLYSSLSQSRIDKLEGIDFEWTVKLGRKINVSMGESTEDGTPKHKATRDHAVQADTSTNDYVGESSQEGIVARRTGEYQDVHVGDGTMGPDEEGSLDSSKSSMQDSEEGRDQAPGDRTDEDASLSLSEEDRIVMQLEKDLMARLDREILAVEEKELMERLDQEIRAAEDRERKEANSRPISTK